MHDINLFSPVKLMSVIGALADVRAGSVRNVFCGWLPRCKCKIYVTTLVGCRLLSGLLMQSFQRTAGPDGIRELGPKLQNRLLCLGHSLGCPGSRSDRYAITSLCAHNS